MEAQRLSENGYTISSGIRGPVGGCAPDVLGRDKTGDIAPAHGKPLYLYLQGKVRDFPWGGHLPPCKCPSVPDGTNCCGSRNLGGDYVCGTPPSNLGETH